MSSINMTRTRVLLEMSLLGKPKLSLHEYVQPWKNVFWINGLVLIELSGLLGKAKVNGLEDKLGIVYMRCTFVKELIT